MKPGALSRPAIRWQRVRSLLTLVGEAHEIGVNTAACRQHVVEGMARLIGATTSLFVTDPAFVVGGSGPYLQVAGFGGGNELRESVEAVARRRDISPVIAALAQSEPRRGQVLTVDRRHVVSDETWYDSVYYTRYLQPAGYDGLMMSARGTGTRGLVSGFGLARRRLEKPFTDEDWGLFDLASEHCTALLDPSSSFFTEAHRLAVGRVSPEMAGRAWSLTPREIEVFALVVDGRSNKEVALALRAALRTIEIHVTSILSKAKVQSRGQLIASYWKGRW